MSPGALLSSALSVKSGLKLLNFASDLSWQSSMSTFAAAACGIAVQTHLAVLLPESSRVVLQDCCVMFWPGPYFSGWQSSTLQRFACCSGKTLEAFLTREPVPIQEMS